MLSGLNKNIYFFIILLLTIVSCSYTHSEDSGVKVEFLIDKSGLEAINTLLQSREFKSLKSNYISEGFTSDVVWLKFTYDESLLGQKHFLVLNESYHDYLDFYKKNGSIWQVIHTGDLRPYNTRVFPHRAFAFSLKNTSGIHTAYLRVSSQDSMNVSFSLMSDDEIHNNQIAMGILYGIFIGGLFSMILYNMFIFFTLKDVSYLYYSVTQFTFLLTNIYLMGYTSKYFWPENPVYNKYYIPLFYGFFVYFTNQFIRSYLDLKKYAPRFDTVIYTFALSGLVILVFSIFSSYRASVMLTSSIISINSPIALIAGIIAHRKGNKSAVYYIIAWAVFLSSGFAAVIGSLGAIVDSLWISHLPQLGGLFEALIFSFALGKRYQLLEESKKLVQGELLEIQEKYSAHLAREVEEKTRELHKTLNLINYDLKLARNIQQNVLLNKENYFSGLKIVTSYQPHSEVSGDFFDIAETQSGVVRFFIADVTGHGLQAALVTMTLKSEYDFFKGKSHSPEKLMEALNASFHKKFMETNIFITAFVLDIDVRNRAIEFSSAGHPPQLLLQYVEKHRVDVLTNRGMPLGALSNNNYSSSKVIMNPGARIYFFTDGLTESYNDKMEEFGEGRLKEEIINSSELTIENQIIHLINRVRSFSKDNILSDDLAFIVVEMEN